MGMHTLLDSPTVTNAQMLRGCENPIFNLRLKKSLLSKLSSFFKWFFKKQKKILVPSLQHFPALEKLFFGETTHNSISLCLFLDFI